MFLPSQIVIVVLLCGSLPAGEICWVVVLTYRFPNGIISIPLDKSTVITENINSPYTYKMFIHYFVLIFLDWFLFD